MQKPKLYRDFIDEMVRVCHEESGQVGANAVRRGVWNQNATSTHLVDQQRVNVLISSLDVMEREVLAKMLADAFESGVFETLKALERHEVEPFVDGYEGSPFHDFIGRLSLDWDWPEDRD